jgi:colanic acid biosynthesis glycosyl transferase WcaI
MSPPRIFLFNRFYAPDLSATSQLAGDLAAHLVGEGFEVHAVAGARAYDGAGGLAREEVIAGVRVHRVRAPAFGRAGLIGRALAYLWLYVAFAWRAWRMLRRGDIALVLTDPPLLLVPLGAVARWRGARVVNWLQDLYPEVAYKLRVGPFAAPGGRLLFRALAALRDHALRGAARNVVIGARMGRMLAQTLPAARTVIIPNWADDEAIRPMPAPNHPLRALWGLEGKFALAYSGNLGRAHDWTTLLDAADLLRARDDIAFLLIGDGFHRASLRRAAEARGLGERFRFVAYQMRERLALSLTAADAHWACLRPELEGCIVPSKVYGVAAAGRPCLFIGAADGEVGGMVREFSCGLQIDMGDARGLADAIQRLADDVALRALMGENARRMIDERFSKAAALARFTEELRAVAAQEGAR